MSKIMIFLEILVCGKEEYSENIGTFYCMFKVQLLSYLSMIYSETCRSGNLEIDCPIISCFDNYKEVIYALVHN